jgi:hypothetical protein
MAAVSVYAWIPSKYQVCKVDTSSGSVSSCTRVPGVFYMGSGGAVSADNMAYLSGQNYTNPNSPWTALTIDLTSQKVSNSALLSSISQSSSTTVMTTYSSFLDVELVVTGNNGYTWAVNGSDVTQWLGAGWGTVGTFNQQLQDFWGLTYSTIYRQNMVRKSTTQMPNTWNCVGIAASQESSILYGVAAAANSTLLYALDTYFGTWSLVGCLKSYSPVSYYPVILDPTEQYLSFLASPINGAPVIVTASVVDFSLVSTAGAVDSRMQLLQAFN